MKNLAIELTILTGQVVTAEKGEGRFDYLHFEDGGKLSLYNSYGRLEISPSRPTGIKVNCYDQTSITVSEARTPEAIARDIARRLLPEAREYWQRCRDQQKKYDADCASVREAVATLEAAGMRKSTWHGDETRAIMHGDDCKADISPSGIYSFDIHRLTVEQAVKILKILGES